MTGENCSVNTVDSSINWSVDSSSSDHLINDKNVFDEYVELKISKRIASAKNGIYLEALGIGNIRVNNFCNNNKVPGIIRNVYYVPDVKKN